VEGGGEGMGEDGVVVVHMVGDGDEIAEGEGELFGEAAISPLDAEDGAGSTMGAEAGSAEVALAALGGDGADNALAGEVL